MEAEKIQDIWYLLDYYFDPEDRTDEEMKAKYPVLRKYNLACNNNSELLELIGGLSKGTALEIYAGWMLRAAFGYCEESSTCYDKLKAYYATHRSVNKL
jgi:hypothetical protein